MNHILHEDVLQIMQISVAIYTPTQWRGKTASFIILIHKGININLHLSYRLQIPEAFNQLHDVKFDDPVHPTPVLNQPFHNCPCSIKNKKEGEETFIWINPSKNYFGYISSFGKIISKFNSITSSVKYPQFSLLNCFWQLWNSTAYRWKSKRDMCMKCPRNAVSIYLYMNMKYSTVQAYTLFVGTRWISMFNYPYSLLMTLVGL